MTEKQLIATLDWMIQMGIIDAIQYNQIYVKSLPYLKG